MRPNWSPLWKLFSPLSYSWKNNIKLSCKVSCMLYSYVFLWKAYLIYRTVRQENEQHEVLLKKRIYNSCFFQACFDGQFSNPGGRKQVFSLLQQKTPDTALTSSWFGFRYFTQKFSQRFQWGLLWQQHVCGFYLQTHPNCSIPNTGQAYSLQQHGKADYSSKLHY